MKVKITLSKEALFTIILLLVGICFFIYGLNVFNRKSNLLQLDDLCIEECKSGQFVSGNINSYILKQISDSGKGSYSGVSQSYNSFGVWHDIYTIPIDNNCYIRIMISDINMLKQMKVFEKGKAIDIYFEGEIIKAPIKPNYKWYESIEVLGSNCTNNIVSEYIIKKANIDEKEKFLYAGIFLLIIASVQIIFIGSLSDFISLEKLGGISD